MAMTIVDGGGVENDVLLVCVRGTEVGCGVASRTLGLHTKMQERSVFVAHLFFVHCTNCMQNKSHESSVM